MRKAHLLQEKEKQAQKSVEESGERFPHIAVVAVLSIASHMDPGSIAGTHCYHYLAATVATVLERPESQTGKKLYFYLHLYTFCTLAHKKHWTRGR